ncbi:MAG: hypothetical protein V4508_07425, partial [Pseudomonadota bacterium]
PCVSSTAMARVAGSDPNREAYSCSSGSEVIRKFFLSFCLTNSTAAMLGVFDTIPATFLQSNELPFARHM